MDRWFEKKVALITGAGQGMGLAAALAFAEEGAAVALADRDAGLAQKAAQELVDAGHKALAIRCDVADESQVQSMVEQTVDTFGRLDAAFNNAGIQSPAVETADASGEEFEHVKPFATRHITILPPQSHTGPATESRHTARPFAWRYPPTRQSGLSIGCLNSLSLLLVHGASR
jgi:NAD(P)-dependent dehydrogenase (short-subunit alcohol dehydrogenase family)